MATVSFSELESLTAEFLPQRIVLSIVNISYVHNTYTTNEFPAQGGAPAGGGDHGSSVAYACNSNDSPPSNSGLLGLFATPGENSMQCVPAAVSNGG
ncbi:MAG: hypothetical protein FWE35_27335 [Streptosporangiales bacterium]|jgi:hypothetical protein|nr:hypothetical protein [Streptosporangiales bacterium]